MISSGNKPKIILILGMHRSGTSLLAHLISRWGAYMGDDLMQPDQYNLDGYWEYFPLVHLHDKMLAATNNLWFAPSEQIDVAEMVNKFGDEARQLVKEMDKPGVDWCWKDPRLPIFLTFWAEILSGREIIFVVSSRHPLSIASSIFERDKLPTLIGVVLWEWTTNIIFQAIRKSPGYCIVHYEKLLEQPDKVVFHLQEFLQENTHKTQNEHAFSDMLLIVKKQMNHNQYVSDFRLSESQQLLYGIYLGGNVPADFRTNEIQDLQLRQFFQLFRQFPDPRNQWLQAELFYRDENAKFDEDHVLKSADLNNDIHFSFGETRTISRLRFDPLNSYTHIRLHSIQIWNKGKVLEVPFTCSSNALEVFENTYLFSTTDPQLYIDFSGDDRVQLDEVVISIEYLQKGAETIPLIVESLHKTVAYLGEKQKELEESNASFLQSSSNTILKLNDVILNQEQLIHKRTGQIEILESQLYQKDQEIEKIHQSWSYILHENIRRVKQNFAPFRLIRAIRQRNIRLKTMKIIGQSGLFDAEYYLTNNADVKSSGLDPLMHYYDYGGSEGRNPSANFDGRFYLKQNPDVKVSGMNPLLHYVKFGKAENRKTYFEPKKTDPPNDFSQGGHQNAPSQLLKRVNPDKSNRYRFLQNSIGVIHAGANRGQEKDIYQQFNLSVLWIEASPETFILLQQNIEKYPRQIAVQALLSDVDNEEIVFHISNNDGASSSIFPLGDHKKFWPQVEYSDKIILRSETLSTLIKRESIDTTLYDTMVLDTQGSELKVLKGSADLLRGIHSLYIETSDCELYQGGCYDSEIEEFLKPFGFVKIDRWLMKTLPETGSCFNVLYQKLNFANQNQKTEIKTDRFKSKTPDMQFPHPLDRDNSNQPSLTQPFQWYRGLNANGRIKAIVMTYDRNAILTEHMIKCYEELWPNHPFDFRIPFQDENRRIKGSNREYVRTSPAIKETVLTLLEDLDDEEWIYWCIDDRYPAFINTKQVESFIEWIKHGKYSEISGLLFCRSENMAQNNFLTGESTIIEGELLLERKAYFKIWVHQFIQVKVIRTMFKGFPDIIIRAALMDPMKNSLIKPTNHRLFVTNSDYTHYEESTIGGKLTVNCLESLKSKGFKIPDWHTGDTVINPILE